MFKEIKKEVYSNPFWIGRNPNNFDYGMAFIITHAICLAIILLSPLWLPIYIIGAITKSKLE